jgi:hypothetical protein
MAKGKGLMLIDLARTTRSSASPSPLGNQPLRIGGSGRGGKLASSRSIVAQTEFQGNRARRGQEIPFRLKPVGSP